MERAELIAHLEHLAEYVKYSEDAPALREVIEMLKCSEMPNSSEERTNKRTETHACDLKAAIDIVVFECGEWTGLAKEISKQLRQLPSAQPERKNGKWNTYYHSDIDFSYSCNQCGYSAPYQMIGGEVFQKKWNFCPNCGADMRGEANDTEIN